MGARFTVERVMATEDRTAFDAFLIARRPTVDEATEWSQAKGYTIPRSCVYGYMAAQSMRACAEASAAMVVAANENNPKALKEAARLLMTQRVFECLQAGVEDGEFSPGDVKDAAYALKAINQSEAIEVAIREDERKRAKEEAAEAVAKASEAVKAGASGAAVVDAIKKAMGIGRAA